MGQPLGVGGGLLRGRRRQRYQQRVGLEAPTGLMRFRLDVNGHARTYWLAVPPEGNAATAPMLIVLHGAGGDGRGMAALSGLDRRGPAAGFVTVFPDGEHRVWNDSRDAAAVRRREGIDDVGFLQALVAQLAADGRGRGTGVYLAGISNGALMSEYLARHGLLPVAGIALVAGPGTERSRETMPRPAVSATVAIFSGTADPLIPYGGGPIGPRKLVGTRRGRVLGAELAATEWAAGNGIVSAPLTGRSTPPRDLPITVMTWRSETRKPKVVLYRIEGGGHTWPGGAQYLPERLIGPAARTLDATGAILSQFRGRETEL